MRRQTLVIAIAFVLALLYAGRTAPRLRSQTNGCGSDRTAIATLTDPDVGTIDTSRVIGVNISGLASFPAPDTIPERSRYDPYETTLYTATADLVQAQLGQNNDIDLVIADPDSGDKVTAVMPDPAGCAQTADPAYARLMEQARDTFVQTYGTPSIATAMPLSGTAQVTGIGFLTPAEAQPGEAANGLEIEPVLSFQVLEGPVTPPGTPVAGQGASPTPAATVTPPPSPTPSASQPSGGITGHLFLVDTMSKAGLIYCDADPALAFAGARGIVQYRSIDLALAAYPNYRLNRPC